MKTAFAATVLVVAIGQNIVAILDYRIEYRRTQKVRKPRGIQSLNNLNNNTSIHHTGTRAPARTREQARATDELRYCGIPSQSEPSCWDCRFFDTSPLLDRDQPPEEECEKGESVRLPPVIDHGNRDADVNYAVFPIVIACDWCGEFAPRRNTPAVRRDIEANAAFDAAAHDDATGGPVCGLPRDV